VTLLIVISELKNIGCKFKICETVSEELNTLFKEDSISIYENFEFVHVHIIFFP
jgi:hypothetical protein